MQRCVGRCSDAVELRMITSEFQHLAFQPPTWLLLPHDLAFQLQENLTEPIATHLLQKYLGNLHHDIERRYGTKVQLIPTTIRRCHT